MCKQALFCLVFLWPIMAPAAEPYGEGSDEERIDALQSLREKQVEAENLQAEIEELRRLAGEPSANVRLRVRLIEVSLTKLRNLGLTPPQRLDEQTFDDEATFALLVQKSVARVREDKTFTVAEGNVARLQAGIESAQGATPVSAGDEGEENRGDFLGTEIGLLPKRQPDGRLFIDLVCRESRQLAVAGEHPQTNIHEVSTSAELAPGGTIVLEGSKDKRVESASRGVIFLPAAFHRVTTTVNEIQTFIVVCRDVRLATKPAAPNRLR